MNAGKVGEPYFYPDSMIRFLAVLYSKGFDYRALTGIMRGLSKHFYNFPVISQPDSKKNAEPSSII